MIQRNNEKTPFTAIKNKVLFSGLLTLEELGLYAVMLSKPVNWEFSEFVLARELKTTPEEIRYLLKRLEQKGFARERRGRYGPVWDLYEISDQIPKGSPQKDWTVPQSVAKAFVDRMMQQGADRKPSAVNDPKPDSNAESEASVESIDTKPTDKKDGSQPMTREQIGQTLIDFAVKLRRNAIQRNADLPNG